MTGLLAALPAEAKPLIRRLRLDERERIGGFDVRHGQDLALVVTGVGRAAMVGGMRALAGWVRARDQHLVSVLNFGTCGALPTYPLGELLLVSSTLDHASGERRQLSPLPGASLPRAAIETFDEAVGPELLAQVAGPLIDMEAAAFVATAQDELRLPTANVAALKIVSDHLDGSWPSAKALAAMIEARITDIVQIISGMPA